MAYLVRAMEELLKALKPNRNTKYYELVLAFVKIMNHEIDARLRFTVEEILGEVEISRPTFYSYYHSAGEFYTDLMEILATIIPEYMTMKSKDLTGPEMVQFSFSMKLGVLMSNMKKIAGKYPDVLAPWNVFFDRSVQEMKVWYMGMLGVDESTGELKARMVMNELLLHEDIYYENFEAYMNLLLKQEPVKTPGSH